MHFITLWMNILKFSKMNKSLILMTGLLICYDSAVKVLMVFIKLWGGNSR